MKKKNLAELWVKKEMSQDTKKTFEKNFLKNTEKKIQEKNKILFHFVQKLI